jgi:hypothetical protein
MTPDICSKNQNGVEWTLCGECGKRVHVCRKVDDPRLRDPAKDCMCSEAHVDFSPLLKRMQEEKQTPNQ